VLQVHLAVLRSVLRGLRRGDSHGTVERQAERVGVLVDGVLGAPHLLGNRVQRHAFAVEPPESDILLSGPRARCGHDCASREGASWSRCATASRMSSDSGSSTPSVVRNSSGATLNSADCAATDTSPLIASLTTWLHAAPCCAWSRASIAATAFSSPSVASR